MTFDGKTALVTGGSRGIGRAIVRRLTDGGARVVYTYRGAPADDLDAIAVRADHADPDSLDTVFEAVGERLDILVNNAATVDVTPLASITAGDFDRVMTVNTKVPMLALIRAAALMPDGGRIINISTLNTVAHGPHMALYCAGKAALEQITAVAAFELGPRGITVNTVSPGATDTDMLRSVNTTEGLDRTATETPLGRLGSPDDVAAVVAWLAGPDSGWITGQNIRATGGLAV